MKKIIELNNGLNIWLYPMNNVHSVTIGLYIKAGIAYDNEKYAGITHLLEHLHFRKLGSMSQSELYYKMESMGSTLRAVTYKDFLKFTMKVVPQRAAEAMMIFAELITAYDWNENELEKEKQVVINQILEKGNYISLDKEVDRIVFKKHALAGLIVGDIASVNKVSVSDIMEYKEASFDTTNMLLCITGNLTEKYEHAIFDILNDIKVKANTKKNILKVPEHLKCRKPDINLVNVEDNNPLEVNISFDITHALNDRKLITILNCILGEGVGSKLQKVIREEKCYSSDICSYIEWYKDFAILHIRFSVIKDYLHACINKIISIVHELKTNITMRDLDVTLPFYTSNMVYLEDDTEEMNFQLAYNEFVLEQKCDVSGIEKSDDTIYELQQIAKHIFVKENVSVVVLGNMKSIYKKDICTLIEEL